VSAAASSTADESRGNSASAARRSEMMSG
jgi:hypothetical protein